MLQRSPPSYMTKETLYTAIEEATAELLDLGRALSWNKIADNCKFILTEIIDGQHNFHVQRVLRKKENDKKVALPFSEIIPPLQNLYDDLYDINLHIYRAGKRLTIIDIRYYLKSSLNSTYRQKVSDTHPMLHCKVA